MASKPLTESEMINAVIQANTAHKEAYNAWADAQRAAEVAWTELVGRSAGLSQALKALGDQRKRHVKMFDTAASVLQGEHMPQTPQA